MHGRRPDRMAIEIKKALSEILHGQIKDPRIDFGTVSVTRVDVANDLGQAKINISVLGSEERQQETMQALHKARGYIRSELARQIQVKHFPELEFRLDRSIEHGLRISALLEELKEEQSKSTDEHIEGNS